MPVVEPDDPSPVVPSPAAKPRQEDVTGPRNPDEVALREFLGVATRILLVGDVHRNAAGFEAMVAHATVLAAEVIVQVGDLGAWYGQRWWPDPFVERSQRALADAGLSMLFVDGNHDRHDLLAEELAANRAEFGADSLNEITANIWHMPRGSRVQVGSSTWLFCGGATSVDRDRRTPGFTWFPTEEPSEADVQACIDGGPADVVVAHEAPHGAVGMAERLGESLPLAERARLSGWPADALADSDRTRQRLRRLAEAVRPHHWWHGHHHRRFDDEVRLVDGQLVEVHCLSMDGLEMELWTALVDPTGSQIVAPCEPPKAG